MLLHGLVYAPVVCLPQGLDPVDLRGVLHHLLPVVLEVLVVPVQGQLGALRLVTEDGGRSLRPQSGWERLRDDALAVERGGDSKRLSKIRPNGGRLDLPGEGGPNVLLAGEGPGQLLGGAGEVAG